MQQVDIFKRLGFPKHSDVVYDVLRKEKEALSITDIAKTTALPRMTVYRVIDALKAQSLIEESQVGRRTFYTAGNPRQLSKLMKLSDAESTKVLAGSIQEFEKDVPHQIQFLRGPAGIRSVFDDVTKHTPKGETFFRYTSEQDLQMVNSYLARDYRQRRDAKKLERKVISNATSGEQKRSRLERFIKFIPAEEDQFQQNIIQLVYGKRVAIIDLTKEEVMIIENKQLADFQKVLFKLLYKKL